jgi:CRISPR-associated exonuclease Cas4
VAQPAYRPEEYISASELEKYGYCPLSWWYSRQGAKEAGQEGLDGGVRVHVDFEHQLEGIQRYEETSKEAEMTVAIFSIVATAIAIAALVISVLVFTWSLAIAALALLWLLAAAMFLYVSLKSTERAWRSRASSGFEDGEIVDIGLADKGGILESSRFGLRGMPDVILRIDGQLVPVELKTGRVPRGPLFSHILQLSAYCLLLEDTQGSPPPYGILQYGSRLRHEIDYTEEMRGMLLDKLTEMRGAIHTQEVHRNHIRSGKCVSCSRRDVCAERLA